MEQEAKHENEEEKENQELHQICQHISEQQHQTSEALKYSHVRHEFNIHGYQQRRMN